MFPQIIDKDLYARVNARLASLQHCGLSSITNYLFSRKLVCGYCGKNINGTSGTYRNDRRYYYRCTRRRKEDPKCIKTALRKDKFENFVINKVIGELNKPDVMNKLIDRLMDIQNDRKKVIEQLHILEREHQKAKAAVNHLIDYLAQGITHQMLIDQINKREEQINTLEKTYQKKKIKLIHHLNESSYRNITMKH